jgi:hypothetical protein
MFLPAPIGCCRRDEEQATRRAHQKLVPKNKSLAQAMEVNRSPILSFAQSIYIIQLIIIIMLY